MAFTRQQITNMRETQLQKEVLIPLFKAMNFSAVTLYHGGPGEQGKDIVMWKEGDLRNRVNYGVVVKAGRISGKATGKGSAAEVYFQVKQCFSEPYADFTSTEPQRVHRCWIVTSGDIPKEAINAIKGELRDSNLDRVTDFIDGDTLWGLIQRYMPEIGIAEQLDSVQKKIDSLIQSDHYRVIANTKNEYIIEAKHPNAFDEQPFVISTLLEFDTRNKEGELALADWQRHIKTGAPVSIGSPHLKEFNFPEFLRPLINVSAEGMRLALGPVRSGKKQPFKIELFSNAGEVATLEYVELEAVQQGVEEVTLENDQQAVPWRVSLISNKKLQRTRLGIRIEDTSLNVRQAVQVLRFYSAMKSGGEIRIENLENGTVLTDKYSPVTKIKDGRHLLRLFEEMAYIQSRTSTPLQVPAEPITADQARLVLMTAGILRTGNATFTSKRWPVLSTPQQVRQAIDSFNVVPPPVLTLDMKEDQQIVLFGVPIILGRAVMTCERFHIEARELDRLRREVETCGPEDKISYHLSLDAPLEAKYLNWLPEEEAAELRKLTFLKRRSAPAAVTPTESGATPRPRRRPRRRD